MPLILNGTTGVSGVDGSAGTPSYQGTDTNTGIFYPAADTIAFAEGGTEVMRIDSSGNVGIGTSSPAERLHVVGNSRTVGDINSFGTGGVVQSRFTSIDAIGGGYVGTTSNHLFYFVTNNTQRMLIDTSGNVGIGTSSPGQKFVVSQGTKATTASAITTVGFSTTDASSFGLFFRQKTDASSANRWNGIQSFDNGVGASSLILQDLGGSVAIGMVASGDTLLEVYGSEAATAYKNVNTGTGLNDGFYVGMGKGASTEAYVYNRENNNLIFGTNNTERMRITSSGQVLISTTAAPGNTNFKFYVSGGLIFGDDQTGVYISPTNQNTINVYNGINTDGNSLWVNYRGFNDGFTRFRNFLVGDGKGNTIATFTGSSGNLNITGALSKGSGSFRIDHPLPELEKTHDLVHSFIEGPQADLIYRGVVSLVNGKAQVNIDEASGMTVGTFEQLCREVQCFTTNESDWVAVRGKVTGNILTIEAQDLTATSSISWMVIGERKDKHMMNTDWTDENGKIIVEPLKKPKDPLEVQAEQIKSKEGF